MNHLTPADPKPQWRAWAAEQHARGIAKPAAAGIIEHGTRLLESLPPTTVVLFSHLPGEVSVDALASVEGHRYALTRTPETGWLTIHDWAGERETHRYGFSQPTPSAPVVPDDRIGAVFVPALAFDRGGYRLGRGAGYYDELFSRLDDAIMRVGVTPRVLVVDELPREAHDVPMHVLLTEYGPVESVL